LMRVACWIGVKGTAGSYKQISFALGLKD